MHLFSRFQRKQAKFQNSFWQQFVKKSEFRLFNVFQRTHNSLNILNKQSMIFMIPIFLPLSVLTRKSKHGHLAKSFGVSTPCTNNKKVHHAHPFFTPDPPGSEDCTWAIKLFSSTREPKARLLISVDGRGHRQGDKTLVQ